MRIDHYTRAILTVIAVLLAVIALRPVFQPASASAQTLMNSVQFMPASSSFNAFNTVNGDVWLYSYDGGKYAARYLGRINQLGQSLTNTGRPPEQK